MSIIVNTGFHIGSATPIDDRLVLTKGQMLNINENLYPDVYMCVCKDDGQLYVYDRSAEISDETGKFRKVADSAIELTKEEYDQLSDEEKNNGTTYYITDVEIEGGTSTGGAEKTYYVNTGRFVMDGLNINATITEISKPNFRGLSSYNGKIVACFTDRIELYSSMETFEAGTPEKTKSLSNIEFNGAAGTITPSQLGGIGTYTICGADYYNPDDINGFTSILVLADGQAYAYTNVINEDFFSISRPSMHSKTLGDGDTYNFLKDGALYQLNVRTLEDGYVQTSLVTYRSPVAGFGNEYTDDISICYTGYSDEYCITGANQVQVSKNVFIVKGTDENGKIIVGYLNGYHEKIMWENVDYQYTTHACVFDNKLVYTSLFDGSEPDRHFKYIDGVNFLPMLMDSEANSICLYNSARAPHYTIGDVTAMVSTENYMLIRFAGEVNKTLIFDKNLNYTPCNLDFNDFDNIIETSDGLYLIRNDVISKIPFEKTEVDLQTALAMVTAGQDYGDTKKY